jgi:endonuclease/exonuclease/phosphatase (EEP) superfamily protein YafD
MAPEQAHRLTGMRPLASHETFPNDEPREQIDHLLARGDVPVPVRSAAPALPLSDHRALCADFD